MQIKAGWTMHACLELIFIAMEYLPKGPYIKYDRNQGGKGVGELQSV